MLKDKNIQVYLLSVFAFLVPLWKLGASIVLGLIVLFSIYEFVTKRRKISLNLINTSCLIYASLNLVSFFVFPDKLHWFEVEKRISLILIPIFIAGYSLSKKQFHFLVLSFIGGVFVLNFAVFISIANYYVEHKSLTFINGGIDRLFLIPRPYLGFFNSIGVGLVISLFFEVSYKLKYKQVLGCVFLLTSFALIVLVAARLSFLINTLLLISGGVYYIVKNKKWVFITLFIPIFILGYFLPNTNIAKRFENFKQTEPRLFIWNSYRTIIEESTDWNMLYGTFSNPKGQGLLEEKYKEETQRGLRSTRKRKEAIQLLKNHNLISTMDTNVVVKDYPDSYGRWFWIYAIRQRFNTHNQYFSSFLSFGILGLTSLLTLFAGLFVQLYKTKSIYTFICVVILGLTLVVENLLSTQLGIFGFLFLLSLILIKVEKNT